MTSSQLITILQSLSNSFFHETSYALENPEDYGLLDYPEVKNIEVINPLVEQNTYVEKMILHFLDHGIYIECKGDVDSYSDSTIYDEFKEVFPVTKTVTFYE